MASGLPYTLLRPSRLTDGPYTSYDLNTLLQVGRAGCGSEAWAMVTLFEPVTDGTAYETNC